MNDYHYVLYAAADVEAALPTSMTTKPRYSVDGTQAILKFAGTGVITQAIALALMATPEWTTQDGTIPL